MLLRCCQLSLIAAALLLAALSSPGLAQDVAADLQAAIDNLASDSFLTREKASDKLLAAGRSAIAPLEAAAAQGELEKTARSLAVLEQLAVDAQDSTVRDEAVAAITRLSTSQLPTVATRAAALATAIVEVRRSQAIDRLEKLGAKFTNQTVVIGAGFLPAAHSLEIGPDWRGTDHDLQALGLIADLRVVSFSGEQVNDVWLKHLTPIKSMQWLKLKKTKVTAAGIEHLKQFKELYAVDFMYFSVDDAAVRPLAEMPQLSLVRLFGTQVSDEGAAKLATDLPTTKIDIRRGGFLGIGIEPHPLGCQISRVEPTSSAARAGLEPGDVILSIAGERPGSFEELTKVIGRFAPAKEIEIELYRRGNREKLKIKLGEWE